MAVRSRLTALYICRGCSKRAEDRKAKLLAKGSSKSVHAVSGGLPTLGKGRK